jgi:hypothetical protein
MSGAGGGQPRPGGQPGAGGGGGGGGGQPRPGGQWADERPTIVRHGALPEPTQTNPYGIGSQQPGLPHVAHGAGTGLDIV